MIKQDIYEQIKTNQQNSNLIPNPSLLHDYPWVYNHVEELFCNSIFYYQRYQNPQAYFIFFLALTTKYSLQEDHTQALYTNNKEPLQKWSKFAQKLIEFMSYSGNQVLSELFQQTEFLNYFLHYPLLYTPEMLMNFSFYGINKLLELNPIATYFTEDYQRLIKLIKKNHYIQVPISILHNPNLISQMTQTHHLEQFHYEMQFILNYDTGQEYYSAHRNFCNNQVANIENNILPCYKQEFASALTTIKLEDLIDKPNTMQLKVFKRIFKRFHTTHLSKTILYSELTKYMIIGMFISSHFETSPHDLMIDIETLYEFASKNNRHLKGEYLYEFLINFENKTLSEIINFYQNFKSSSLKEILYDDWKEQEELFVLELNSKLLNPLTLPPVISANGLIYYDISDTPNLLLVHNTDVPKDNPEEIAKMINRIQTGNIRRICLSVNDQEHNYYYKNFVKGTIKFLYGPLNPNKVGIVYHKDAYTLDINLIETECIDYTRKLYTVKSLQASTYDYNEINYLIAQEPILPIGVICEEEISLPEIQLAQALNIPVLYQRKKKALKKSPVLDQPQKRYFRASNNPPI